MLPPPLPQESPSRLEVALTVVYPGVGQFLQQRWGPAIIYCTLATILSAVLLVCTFMPVIQNLAIILGMGDHSVNDPLVIPSIPTLLLSFSAFMVIYIFSIIDASAAYRKRVLRWKRAQRRE